MAETISYGKTVSQNYQSKRVDITLVVPDGWKPGEVMLIAQGIVHETMDLPYPKRTANELAREYYDDKDLTIADLCPERVLEDYRTESFTESGNTKRSTRDRF